MCSNSKPLLRLAAAIHNHLATAAATERLIELPLNAWQRCVDIVRRIRRARLRGWHLAAAVLIGDLRYALPAVEQELAAIRGRLPQSLSPDYLATPGVIFGDLLALRHEFAALEFDLSGRWLSVTTEPITLQGVYLGAFEIRLAWCYSSDRGPSYRIMARDPHPAAGRDNVTHPHVQDEHLCEGEGRPSIRAALAQGRLLDFFMLVAAVLRTYNSESPFVELALWQGATCFDCGAVVDEDEGYACRHCEETVCGECERGCSGCDTSFCAGCIAACDACGESYCACCLKPCEGCRNQCCFSCLDDCERCSNCHAEESGEEDANDQADSPTDSPAVQPHSVGQAVVPAGRG